MSTVLEQLSASVASLLREDPRRVALGEDVRDGGMLGLTRVAAEDEALRDRLLGLPLNTSAGLAHAAGLALGGSRPMVLLPSAAGLVDALAALREATRFSSRYDTERALPILIVAPCGPGFGLGGDAAIDVAAHLACVEGLRVLVGSDPAQFPGLLRSAASFDAGESPTVLLLPRNLLLREAPEDAHDAHDDPLDQVRTIRAGDEVTVFCWGASVERVREAAHTADVSAHVTDLVSLSPLDKPGILEAARTTGRVVIVGAGGSANGAASQLAALLADEGILHLDAPVRHLHGRGRDVEARHEHDLIPSVDAIRDTLVATASF